MNSYVSTDFASWLLDMPLAYTLQSDIIHVYWSVLLLLFGFCIGSFLNVVIYRWSRDLSIRKPLRSFCPHCNAGIHWYDNLPVISYILLRGRCRSCSAPISMQYPLVELMTGFVFFLCYDAFFVERLRLGIGRDLADDWPMLIAHLILWAGLMTLTVMDLEAYMVDIRVTWIISAAGIVLHTFWTPDSSLGGSIYGSPWIRPGTATTALVFGSALGFVVACAVVILIQSRRPPLPQPDEAKPGSEPSSELNGGREPTQAGATADPPAETQAKTTPLEIAPEPGSNSPASAEPERSPATASLLPPALVLFGLAVVIAFTVYLLKVEHALPLEREVAIAARSLAPVDPSVLASASTVALALIPIMLTLSLAAGHPQPEADHQIIEDIESEAPESEGNAMWELKLLTPAVLLGVGACVLVLQFPDGLVAAGISDALGWSPTGEWRPLLGFSTGLAGWIIGGGLAWLARIGFTLLFRKEALGMGDVHILAAGGAIAGWPVVVLGFFLAAPLALLGMLVIRLRRGGRALPYGPWLALAFLIAALFQDHILLYLQIRGLLE